MKLSIVTNELIGEILATNIYISNKTLLARKGTTINNALITRLKDMSINTIYIEDENTEIIVENIIDSNEKINMVKELEIILNEITKKKMIDVIAIENISKNLISTINLSQNSMFIKSVLFSNELSNMAIHAIDVATISLMIAVKLNYNYEKLKYLVVGALLHDIGKIIEGEGDFPIKGYQFLSNFRNISSLSKVAILQQKETPKSNPDAHLNSKIISVANSYVEQLSNSKMLPHEILEWIMSKTYELFDAEVVKSLRKSIFIYPNGLQVQINNKINGLVVSQNPEFPDRPIVKISHDGKKALLDLIKNKTLYISDIKI